MAADTDHLRKVIGHRQAATVHREWAKLCSTEKGRNIQLIAAKRHQAYAEAVARKINGGEG